MSWGSRIIQDVEYDWTHLDDHIVHVHMNPADQTAASYRVLVSYGHHCFARELREDDHADFRVLNKFGLDPRCACPLRTQQSKNLPRIIREAALGDMAYFSQDTNMLLVEDLEGVAGPYAIFFNVRQAAKQGRDVLLYVASAYTKPELPDRLNYVPFKALIAKAANGHKPFRPDKTKSWRAQLQAKAEKKAVQDTQELPKADAAE